MGKRQTNNTRQMRNGLQKKVNNTKAKGNIKVVFNSSFSVYVSLSSPCFTAANGVFVRFQYEFKV